MTAIVISIALKFWPFIVGALGLLGWGVHQRRAGAKAERAKQAEAEARARDVADQVDADLHTLTPEQRRERLKTWGE